MACCAMPGGCADPACYLCAVVAKLPQPESAVEQEQRRTLNATRDGAPKLSGEKARNPVFEKRRRVGPHR